MESRGRGIARLTNMLRDEQWSDWLPIYAWIIEHDEGLHPRRHRRNRACAATGLSPALASVLSTSRPLFGASGRGIGPQLRARGISLLDIRHVVLTHLHTDHAGGLHHVTGTRVWVSRGEFERASGIAGRAQGYLPHRWPTWWEPEFVHFERQRFGPFDEARPLTRRGDVVILQTPGHTPASPLRVRQRRSVVPDCRRHQLQPGAASRWQG